MIDDVPEPAGPRGSTPRSRWSGVRRCGIGGLAGVVSIAALVMCACEVPLPGEVAPSETPPPALDPRAASGTLTVSLFGGTATSADADPVLHHTTFVNGPVYDGMEDNDLRGFLDGTFKYAWNQPGQIHVRLGRRDRSPRYGEHELFRVSQRWAGVSLVPGAIVHEASLDVVLEKEPPEPVMLMLYEVKKDFDPGAGGTLGNNVSPPRPGEMWWNERAHGVDPWGLPGLGFASDSDPDADTGAMPLAMARASRDTDTVRFTSPELAAYVTRRVAERAPLLFLLKLADEDEDTVGSLIYLYSGNHGATRSVGRRPDLHLTWSAPTTVPSLVRTIRLEHGRSWSPPALDRLRATHVAASFVPDDGSDLVDVSIRTVAGLESMAVPRPIPFDLVRLELRAARDPIPLGGVFEDHLCDTWVRTAPPDSQIVRWHFHAPSGAEHTVDAVYDGHDTWRVTFSPDELGAWRYVWTQSFVEEPFTSEWGRFDVIATDLAAVMAALEVLRNEAREAGEPHPRRPDPILLSRFLGLERAVMQLHTARSWQSADVVRERLREVREAIGEPVPDPIPMVPDDPPDWANRGSGTNGE